MASEIDHIWSYVCMYTVHNLQVFLTQDGFFFETLLERILHSCPLDRKAASPKHACCTVITMAHDRTNKSLLFPPLGHCACRSYIPQSGRHMMRASAVLAWRKQAKLTKPRLCRLLVTWKLKFLMGMVHLLPRSYQLSANEKTSCRELWSTLCCFWLGSTSNPMNLNEHLSCKLVPSRFKLECSCLWWSSWGEKKPAARFRDTGNGVQPCILPKDSLLLPVP